MRTYGKNKPPSKLGSGTTYIATTLESPDGSSDWADFSSSSVSVKNNNTRPSALQDRGISSVNDDINIISTSTTTTRIPKDRCGKRARCHISEVVKSGNADDLRYVSDCILLYNKNPTLTGGTLFVRVPDCWSYENAVKFVNWLKQLGFTEAYLGPVSGYNIPKETVSWNEKNDE